MGSQHEILWHNLSKETGLPWCLLLSARSAPDFNTALWYYHCVLAVLALSSLSGLCSKSPACQAVPGMAQSHRELTQITLMVVVLRSSYLHSHSRQYASTSFPGTGMGSTTCRQLLQCKETKISNRMRRNQCSVEGCCGDSAPAFTLG